jgi:hypothetical protein
VNRQHRRRLLVVKVASRERLAWSGSGVLSRFFARPDELKATSPSDGVFDKFS